MVGSETMEKRELAGTLLDLSPTNSYKLTRKGEEAMK